MTKAGEGESVLGAIDLKNKVHSALAKYKRLHITFRKPSPELPVVEDPASPKVIPSVVTESQWKFETSIPESVSVSDLELDPTTPQAQLAVLKKKYDLCICLHCHHMLCTCRRAPTARAQFSGVEAEGSGSCSEQPELKGKAPVIPFGMDLYHWGSSSADVEARTLAP